MFRRPTKFRTCHNGKQKLRDDKFHYRYIRQHKTKHATRDKKLEDKCVKSLYDLLEQKIILPSFEEQPTVSVGLQRQNELDRLFLFLIRFIIQIISTADKRKNILRLPFFICIAAFLFCNVVLAASTTDIPDNIPSEINDGVLKKLPIEVQKVALEVYKKADANAKRNMRIIAKGSLHMLDVKYTTSRSDLRYKKYDKKALSEVSAAVVSFEGHSQFFCLRNIDVIYNPSFFENPIERKMAQYIHENVHTTNIICTEQMGNGTANPYYDLKGWSEFHRNLEDFTSTLEAVVSNITNTLQSEYLITDDELVLDKHILYGKITNVQIAVYQGTNYKNVITINYEAFNNMQFVINVIPESVKLGAEYVEYYFQRMHSAGTNFLIHAFSFLQMEELYRNTDKYASEMSAYMDQYFPVRIQEKLCAHCVKTRDRFLNKCLYMLRELGSKK